jgi:hypothetical protein
LFPLLIERCQFDQHCPIESCELFGVTCRSHLGNVILSTWTASGAAKWAKLIMPEAVCQFHKTRNRVIAVRGGRKLTEAHPCPTCYGWLRLGSTCKHEKYICPSCGRKQCLLHWPYPMQTRAEAIHFLKSAEVRTGKRCFVRKVRRGSFVKWKIFTSDQDYRNFMETGKHRR